LRTAVLASGSGTNFEALAEAHRQGMLAPAELVVVICNVPGAGVRRERNFSPRAVERRQLDRPVVVVDGAARDIDMCEKFEFPVYARGTVPITARGRIMQESFNKAVRIGNIQVRPGDIVMADINGIVIIPLEKLDEVLEAAEQILQKEEAMVAELKRGVPIMEVDKKYGYEQMLRK